MSRPKVSVIVLSHRPHLLPSAIASVLGQTFTDYQLLTQFAPTYWPSKLNEVVNLSRGEWIVILCDDDLLAPTYLERCMREADDADIVYTDRRHFKDGEDPMTAEPFLMHGDAFEFGTANRIKIPPESFITGSSLPMTICTRRTFWDQLGGYDNIPHADTEFWYRALLADARLIHISEPLFLYREHATQQSRLYDSMKDALRAFHRKHFLRFGVRFDSMVELGDDKQRLEVLKPILRLAHATTHFTSLTTTGYMATEKQPLTETAKTAIRLTQDRAQSEVNHIIRTVLEEMGLSPVDGWHLNDQYEAVRVVKDAA